MKKKHHSCVLAYGQSATGKTHTMMGHPQDPGLTLRLSQQIPEYFNSIPSGEDVDDTKITISYLEVYNEKVRDLLRSDYGHGKYSGILRIREHPKKGPYVQGLTERQVQNQEELLHWIKFGSDNRRVASNLRNPHSSRSHSVVTITCDGVRLYLVDLAGSEKTGSKFWANSSIREGANINKSLVALGNVISALAEPPLKLKSNRKRFVPYRDSVLTWLLKDTLGGNSNTVMIATISPASGCYSETVNTLRFGQRAKLIICSPVVNEDPKEKIIRELRLEIAKLKKELEQSKVDPLSFMPKSEHFPDEANDRTNIESYDSTIPDPGYSPSPHSNSITTFRRNKNKTELKTSNQSSLRINTDKLMSVMNVETGISSEKRQIPKLRRTSSVNSVAIMNRSRTPSFGSRESLPTVESPTSSIKSNLSTTSKLSSSNPLIRRRSVDKSNVLTKRTTPEKQKKYLEKSVETESTKIPVRLKAVPQGKVTPINKSNIIANVTKRLYAKTKNSETDMEGFDEPKNDVPKELTICSNARIRLKEITQKAMRAHRFKQVETQTDTIVLRVKEVSTDVQDLRLHIPEVRNVETMTKADTRSVSTGCPSIDNFKATDTNDLLKITKTVGVQYSSDSSAPKQTTPREPHSPPLISFTKFLINQQFPSRTSTINPNPTNQENFDDMSSSKKRLVNTERHESLSDDSLDDQNGCSLTFPTPDLISNHNSLDLNVFAMQKEEPITLDRLRLRYAQGSIEHVQFDTLGDKLNSSNLITSPVGHEKRTVDVSQHILQPKDNDCEKFITCEFLSSPELRFSKAVISNIRDSFQFDSVAVYEPTVIEPSAVFSSEESCTLSDNGSVRETPKLQEYSIPTDVEHLPTPDTKNQQMVVAMSVFLEEATKLMTNLTKASENLATFHNSSMKKEFDLHITSDNVNDLRSLFRSENNLSVSRMEQTEYVPSYESSSQTPVIGFSTHSTQYETFDIPVNELDPILDDACVKLENTVKNSKLRLLNSVKDSTLSFSSGVSEVYRDLSLESNNSSPSDYGSLCQSSHKKYIPRCSPSALLKQLSHMRRHVMKASKECLLDAEVLRVHHKI
ncbi:kinesin heavy chain-like isoform X2 [Coccinella septempunctata]|nr:kinesin heavy chain-like isoform X2 [Coccinella septempunctata]